jgi:hypothetical protein
MRAYLAEVLRFTGDLVGAQHEIDLARAAMRAQQPALESTPTFQGGDFLVAIETRIAIDAQKLTSRPTASASAGRSWKAAYRPARPWSRSPPQKASARRSCSGFSVKRAARC